MTSGDPYIQRSWRIQTQAFAVMIIDRVNGPILLGLLSAGACLIQARLKPDGVLLDQAIFPSDFRSRLLQDPTIPWF